MKTKLIIYVATAMLAVAESIAGHARSRGLTANVRDAEALPQGEPAEVGYDVAILPAGEPWDALAMDYMVAGVDVVREEPSLDMIDSIADGRRHHRYEPDPPGTTDPVGPQPDAVGGKPHVEPTPTTDPVTPQPDAAPAPPADDAPRAARKAK